MKKTNLIKKTRKNRGVVWQDDATNFLIDVWGGGGGEEFLQLQLFCLHKTLLCFNKYKYIENITWLRGNMKFISSVEHDISRVSEANEWDILLSTRNKFHISKR